MFKEFVGLFLLSSQVTNEFDQLSWKSKLPIHRAKLGEINWLVEIMLRCFHIFRQIILKDWLAWIFEDEYTWIQALWILHSHYWLNFIKVCELSLLFLCIIIVWNCILANLLFPDFFPFLCFSQQIGAFFPVLFLVPVNHLFENIFLFHLFFFWISSRFWFFGLAYIHGFSQIDHRVFLTR